MRQRRNGKYILVAMAVATFLGTPSAYYGYRRWLRWHNFGQMVTWDKWTVALPGGGSVEYLNQSPRERLLGPADTKKSLIWTSSGGKGHKYSLGSIGAGYSDLEMRLRGDRHGLWFIDWGQRRIVACLEFNTGRFYSLDSARSEEEGLPLWATWRGGISLGRRKFR